jgi:hypothetical protein
MLTWTCANWPTRARNDAVVNGLAGASSLGASRIGSLEEKAAMNRNEYVYATMGGWQYEVWYGNTLRVIGGARTWERARQLAALA